MTVFLCIIGGLVLLLSIPFRIHVEWDEEPCMRLGWLFLRFPLYPPREAKEKKAPETPTRKQEKPPKAEPTSKAKASFEETVGMITDIIHAAKGGLRTIVRHIWVSRLDLQMAVATEDSAQTAIRYAQTTAWANGIYGMLQCMVRMKRVSLDIRPDFLSEETRIRLELCVKSRPLFLLGGVFRMAGSFLVRFLRRLMHREKPAEQPTEAAASKQG